MKKKRISNVFISLFLLASMILSLCSFSPAQISEEEIADGTNVEDAVFTDGEEAPLSAVLTNRHYTSGENITVNFTVRDDCTAIDHTYTATGFNVVSIINEGNIFSATLAYNNLTSEPVFTFSIDLGINEETGAEEVSTAVVYGSVDENGIFLSTSCTEDAVRNMYAFQLERGEITLNEYHYIMENYCWDDNVPMSVMSEGAELMGNVNLARFEIILPPVTPPVHGDHMVEGNFYWKDHNNVSHPLMYTEVRLFDSSTGQIKATAYTDAQGHYSLTTSFGGSYMDLYVSALSDDGNVAVEDSNGISYTARSVTYRNVPAEYTQVVNHTITMNTLSGQAFQIMQAAIHASNYAEAMNGSALSDVTVEYPRNDGLDTCSYYSSIDTIKISAPSTGDEILKTYNSWDVIMHEYGHHVEAEMDITDSPGGSHSYDQYLPCDYDVYDAYKLAWAEGYASIFGAMAQQYYGSILTNIYTVGDAMRSAYNSSTPDNYESERFADALKAIGIGKGEGCEGDVASVLWDIYDNTPLEAHDKVNLTHQQHWDIVTGYGAITLASFCSGYYQYFSHSLERKIELADILNHHRIGMADIIKNNESNNNVEFNTIEFEQFNIYELYPDYQPNNFFHIIVYNSSYQEIFNVFNVEASSYTFTYEQLNLINSQSGAVYVVLIEFIKTEEMFIGGYYSKYVVIN